MSTDSSHTATPPQPMTARNVLESSSGSREGSVVQAPATATAASVMQPPLRRFGHWLGDCLPPAAEWRARTGRFSPRRPMRRLSPPNDTFVRGEPQSRAAQAGRRGRGRGASGAGHGAAGGVGERSRRLRAAHREPPRRTGRWARRGCRAWPPGASSSRTAVAVRSSSRAATTRSAGMPAASARRSSTSRSPTSSPRAQYAESRPRPRRCCSVLLHGLAVLVLALLERAGEQAVGQERVGAPLELVEVEERQAVRAPRRRAGARRRRRAPRGRTCPRGTRRSRHPRAARAGSSSNAAKRQVSRSASSPSSSSAVSQRDAPT